MRYCSCPLWPRSGSTAWTRPKVVPGVVRSTTKKAGGETNCGALSFTSKTITFTVVVALYAKKIVIWSDHLP